MSVYGIIRVIIVKTKIKMKNRSHRYDKNRTKYSHGHK